MARTGWKNAWRKNRSEMVLKGRSRDAGTCGRHMKGCGSKEQQDYVILQYITCVDQSSSPVHTQSITELKFKHGILTMTLSVAYYITSERGIILGSEIWVIHGNTLAPYFRRNCSQLTSVLEEMQATSPATIRSPQSASNHFQNHILSDPFRSRLLWRAWRLHLFQRRPYA